MKRVVDMTDAELIRELCEVETGLSGKSTQFVEDMSGELELAEDDGEDFVMTPGQHQYAVDLVEESRARR